MHCRGGQTGLCICTHNVRPNEENQFYVIITSHESYVFCFMLQRSLWKNANSHKEAPKL